MTSQDTFGLVTGLTFSSELSVSLIKKKIVSHVSPEIHHQLENPCKELFSTELHWEIFCCITSYDYNSKKRLGHLRIEDGRERCKYLSEETIKKIAGMSKVR